MQIGAANAAGADFNQRRLLRNFRPWHVANNRLRAGPVIGANTNLFQNNSSGPSAIVDCCAWANRNLCETGSAANVRAARTCGAVDRLVTPPEVCANLDRECGVLRDRWTMVAVLVVVRLTMAFQFQALPRSRGYRAASSALFSLIPETRSACVLRQALRWHCRRCDPARGRRRDPCTPGS